MTSIKKRDDEKLMTIGGCGIFSAVLITVLFTAGNLFHMGAVLTGLAVIALIGCGLSWYQLIKNFADPNKDYWRWLCILFAIAGILIIMGNRASWKESQQVQIDSATDAAKP